MITESKFNPLHSQQWITAKFIKISLWPLCWNAFQKGRGRGRGRGQVRKPCQHFQAEARRTRESARGAGLQRWDPLQNAEEGKIPARWGREWERSCSQLACLQGSAIQGAVAQGKAMSSGNAVPVPPGHLGMAMLSRQRICTGFWSSRELSGL